LVRWRAFDREQPSLVRFPDRTFRPAGTSGSTPHRVCALPPCVRGSPGGAG